jgi:transcriptional regulator with XRE-family HTH domain
MKMREALGAALRRRRLAQRRTLREVAAAAGVSLTYLSEVERGRKEASSEVLEAVCAALDVVLADLLFEVAGTLAGAEVAARTRAIGFLPPAAARPTLPSAVGFLPPAVPAPAREPAPAPMAPVLDLRAFAGRRSA